MTGDELPATVEAGGLLLTYEERGKGDPIVLIHGTATDRSLWRETAAALEGAGRIVAYDRRGYGASQAPEPYGATTVEEQAEDAAALIEALGAAPAVVCGHDLGAVICLDLLRRHADVARAAVLVEPPLHSLSERGAEAVAQLREAIEAGAREGGPAGAVDAFVVETAGADALERLGDDRVGAARTAAGAFAADLVAAPSWQFGRRDLRELGAPVALLAGSRSAAIWGEIAKELGSLLGAAQPRWLDAGHLIPVEAPADVARAVREMQAA